MALKKVSESKTFGGVLLVAGTTIGAAVLALPISTGLAGFGPSITLFIGCWLYLFYTSLLFLEATLWFKEDINFITLSEATLGKTGKGLCWIFYLFLLYSLNTAYIAGSSGVFHRMMDTSLPYWTTSLALLIVVGVFIYRGIQAVDLINRLFMIGLVAAYCLLVGFVAPEVQAEKLAYTDWSYALIAIAVTVTAFGYHIIIPSLATYLDRDVYRLKKSLVIGSLIALSFYSLWEFVMLGVLPIDGANGIIEANAFGKPATDLLDAILGNVWINTIARFFEVFAIVTSFLGVSLSLSDFFADGLHIKKTVLGKITLCVLTLVPPYLITLVNPRAFLAGLEYAGVFGVVVLLGLFPAVIVWRGRYTLNKTGDYRAPGGKPVLGVVILGSLAVIGLEVYNKIQPYIQ